MSGLCLTREDSRAKVFGYATSLPGTACVFGTDPRDEGSHCIMDKGAYGSFGWCFTSQDTSSWGSCSESCPLFGPAKVLADEIRSLGERLAEIRALTTPERIEEIASTAAIRSLDSLTAST